MRAAFHTVPTTGTSPGDSTATGALSAREIAERLNGRVAECVDEQDVVDPGRLHLTRDAYLHFRTWALAEGYRENKLPAINAFTQRVVANARGVESHRTGKGRFLRGLKLVSNPGG